MDCGREVLTHPVNICLLRPDNAPYHRRASCVPHIGHTHACIQERRCSREVASRYPRRYIQHCRSLGCNLFWSVGLDKLGALVDKWNRQPATYSSTEMRECLDGWREVLFTHLDQEVRIFSQLLVFDTNRLHRRSMISLERT